MTTLCLAFVLGLCLYLDASVAMLDYSDIHSLCVIAGPPLQFFSRTLQSQIHLAAKNIHHICLSVSKFPTCLMFLHRHRDALKCTDLLRLQHSKMALPAVFRVYECTSWHISPCLFNCKHTPSVPVERRRWDSIWIAFQVGNQGHLVHKLGKWSEGRICKHSFRPNQKHPAEVILTIMASQSNFVFHLKLSFSLFIFFFSLQLFPSLSFKNQTDSYTHAGKCTSSVAVNPQLLLFT